MALLIVISLLFVSYKYTYKNLPKLTVTYNGKPLTVGQGSYNWKSKGKTKVYTVDSYAKVINTLIPPTNVNANSQLKLEFDYQPTSIVLSGGASSNDTNRVEKNTINISNENGLKVYFLDCTWKEGTITYIIAVKV